ncbi:MAG TPA: SIS domain-containing protein [Firmicutes bacterium]|nr:SIS domain-containing protein [Bacillota bacterium]
MNPTEAYHAEVTRILSRIVSEESENIRKAAGVLADCVEKGKLIHVFGTGGHSYIAGEEMFYRAGGLQPVNAILDPGVSLAAGARRSTVVERTPGYARAVLDAYGVSEGEAIVLVNVNGINSVTIESAMECKKRGVTVIGVTSREFSINVPPGAPARHPSNKNLFELADIVIDIHIPPGDALLTLPGVKPRVAAGSTVMVAFALNCLVAETINLLAQRGIEPPVWVSANLPGGDEANRKFIEANTSRIRHL